MKYSEVADAKRKLWARSEKHYILGRREASYN
jgi:hypothetical protein